MTIAEKLKKSPGWTREGQEISRLYTFSGSSRPWRCEPRATLAESDGSSPGYRHSVQEGKLTLSTHSAGGLTDLDFTARKIDA